MRRINYNFERSKVKKFNKSILLTAFFAQIISLYFFTIIGRFDASESDNILTNYSALSGLASTISMCILVIYGAIIINGTLVKNYIGENKIRTYSYPNGRSQLFYDKVMAFSSVFNSFQFLGMAAANIVYLIIESLFPILDSRVFALSYLVHFFIINISTAILTVSLIIFSGLAGVYLNSTVATIVTGVVLIAVLGNVLAMAFASHLLVTLISTILIAFLSVILIKLTGIKIEQDEVLS